MTEPQLQPQGLQVEQQQYQHMMAVSSLKRAMKNGANTFYWIAALSLINTAIAAFGGTMTFVIGLGITQWIDVLSGLFAGELREVAIPIKIVSIVLNLAIMGLVALFGYLAGKGRKWAFIIGMVLYGLDALLFLPVKDWWSIGFHAYMLWALFNGLRALNQLQVLVPQTGADTAFPQDIGA